MTKTRVILSVLIVTLMSLALAVFDSSLHSTSKNIFYLFDGLLLTSAIIVLTISLFSLDKKNRIPCGSIPYRFIVYFNDGKVPKEIKLCPMFWTVCLALFGTVIGIFGGALVVVLTLSILKVILNEVLLNPGASMAIVGEVVLRVLLFYGVLFGVNLTFKKLGRKHPNLDTLTFIFFLVLTSLTAFLTHAVYETMGYMGFVRYVVYMVSLLGTVAVLLSLVIGSGYVVHRSVPILRNSLIGQLASSIAGNLCPVIEIESLPTEESDTVIDY